MMPAALKRGTQPRSPERARLAECIAAHADAVARLERINEALGRLNDAFFGELQPMVRKAMDRLAEAKLNEPQRFVDEFLGEAQAGGAPSLADAEKALREAESAVEHARQARKLLAEEAVRAERSVAFAESRLNEAVDAAACAESAALLPHFAKCLQQLAEAAAPLLSLPSTVMPPNVSGWHSGGGVNIRIECDKPDPAVAAWLAALREDTDTVLPGLPPPEPSDANCGTPIAA